jgi:ribosomal protein S4
VAFPLLIDRHLDINALGRYVQLHATQVGFPDWVEVDDKKMSGILKSVPDRQEILPDINESLVVELYSK